MGSSMSTRVPMNKNPEVRGQGAESRGRVNCNGSINVYSGCKECKNPLNRFVNDVEKKEKKLLDT